MIDVEQATVILHNLGYLVTPFHNGERYEVLEPKKFKVYNQTKEEFCLFAEALHLAHEQSRS